MESWSVFDPPFLGFNSQGRQVIIVAIRDLEFLAINGDGLFFIDSINEFRNVMRYDPAADRWYDVSAGEEPL